MKKLLGIVVLDLILIKPAIGRADYVNLSKDVASGNKYFKSLTEKGYKKYGMQVVNKKDGHPVRAGKKSIRFEVRAGDCGVTPDWSDCDTDRERHELSGKPMSGGEWWYAWSIFLPKDFINIYPTKLALGQFHQKKGHVVWMFQNQGYTPGGYWVDNQVSGETIALDQIITQDEMIEKWNDILVNVKWSKKEDGFFKVWLNNKLVYGYKGPTKTKEETYFKFGIYRSYLRRWYEEVKYSVNEKWIKYKGKKIPTQIVYFDEIRAGKSREKVVGNLPPLQ
jgi:hypothetical protein